MKFAPASWDVLTIETGKGMSDKNAMMECKGHFGSCEHSEADKVHFGKLKYIRDLMLDESEEANVLKTAFEEAVDDYLAMCEAEEGIEPNKPLKGSFSVRPGRELHHRAVTCAKRQGVNLDAVVNDALRDYLDNKESAA